MPESYNARTSSIQETAAGWSSEKCGYFNILQASSGAVVRLNGGDMTVPGELPLIKIWLLGWLRFVIRIELHGTNERR